MFRQVWTVAIALSVALASLTLGCNKPPEPSQQDDVTELRPVLPGPVVSHEETAKAAKSDEERAQKGAAGASADKKPSKNKPEASSDVDRLVESLANRNPAPKLIRSQGLGRFELDDVVPLFDKSYDWKEQDRVLAATEAVAANETPEMWERLVAHQDDRRYWLTLADEAGAADFGEADNYTVGDYCTELASSQLFFPVEQHLHIIQGPRISDVRPQHRPIVPPFGNDLRQWRKSRSRKTFLELQIEICKLAIDDLPGLGDTSAEHKADFRAKMESEIERLRKSKTGLFGGGSYAGAFSGERYNQFDAGRATEIREAYETAKKRGDAKNASEAGQNDKGKR
jgi:hypothetical protein